MQEIIEMAKVHLQNVGVKIKELENQKQIIQNEIEKLSSYLNDGANKINTVESQINNA